MNFKLEPISHFLSDAETSSSESKYKRKKRYTRYCGNCGRKGHLYRECSDDITSFGVIAIRRKTEDRLSKETCEKFELEHTNPDKPELRILLVQRKDTMGFVDFIRGRYPEHEPDKSTHIKILMEEMIPEERERIMNLTFDQLWDKLWINHNSRCYKNEKEEAKKKFEKLNVQEILDNTSTVWKYTEFGIPKGRRNKNETNLECAEREFREETGYKNEHYRMLTSEPYIQESFTGTNKKRYKHIYYVAEVFDTVGPPSVSADNKNQIGEIKDIYWFTEKECLQVIRSYDKAKKNVIISTFQDFGKFGN